MLVAMWARAIPGVILCLIGAVWTLQGVGVVGGSFMTGQAQWAVIGAVCIAAGAWLLRSALRLRAR